MVWCMYSGVGVCMWAGRGDDCAALCRLQQRRPVQGTRTRHDGTKKHIHTYEGYMLYTLLFSSPSVFSQNLAVCVLPVCLSVR
jgi:hypothetical protein